MGKQQNFRNLMCIGAHRELAAGVYDLEINIYIITHHELVSYGIYPL
ncbi:MAG: hypothetical protein RSC20_06660 [Clostridiales bacterium]